MNFYSCPCLFFIHIFKYVTLPDPMFFSTNLAVSQSSVCLICTPIRSLVCFLKRKLFHQPLFDILTPLLSTPSVFPRMVAFSFCKAIFDIVSALSQAISFVVSDIITISQFSTASIFVKLMIVISRISANCSKSLDFPNLTVLRFSNSSR